MANGIEILILLLIIIAVGFIALSIYAHNLAESLVIKVTDWCIRKMELYETKGIRRLSFKGLIWYVCSFILRIFRYIDRIENDRIKAGLKLNAVSIIVSLTIAIVSFLFIAFFYIVALYIAFKIFMYVLWLMAGRPQGESYGSDLNDVYNTLKKLFKFAKPSEEKTTVKLRKLK